jgi:hypothetical protein
MWRSAPELAERGDGHAAVAVLAVALSASGRHRQDLRQPAVGPDEEHLAGHVDLHPRRRARRDQRRRVGRVGEGGDSRGVGGAGAGEGGDLLEGHDRQCCRGAVVAVGRAGVVVEADQAGLEAQDVVAHGAHGEVTGGRGDGVYRRDRRHGRRSGGRQRRAGPSSRASDGRKRQRSAGRSGFAGYGGRGRGER